MRRRLSALAVILAGVVVADCGLDDLVSPGEGGRVSLSLTVISSAAAVGSEATLTATVNVTSVGGRRVTWTAGVARRSSWLSLSSSSGTVPSSVTLTLDPTGLGVGQFRDTVMFNTGGNTGAPVALPVEFTITECDLVEFTLGETLSGSLSNADCGAPNRGGSFAHVYSFDATAGDSVSVVLRSDAFDGFLVLSSATETPVATAGGDGNRQGVTEGAIDLGQRTDLRSVTEPEPSPPRGPAGLARALRMMPLAEDDDCQGVPGDPCLVNVLLPDDGTYLVEVTTAESGQTGAYSVEISGPRAPGSTSLLRQFQRDGVIPVLQGQAVSGTEAVLTAVVSDPDALDSLRIEVEVKPVGTPFDDVPSASGALVTNGDTAQATVSGLVDDTEYHWQARAVDFTGRAGPWVPFGTNTDPDGVDFRTVVSDLPDAPSGLDQSRTDATQLPLGASTAESSVRFTGTVSDPDGDNVRLEVEVVPVGTDFTNTPTGTSVPFTSGTVAVLVVSNLSDDTDYHWQARAIDANGLTGPWVSFGGNPEDEADFTVLVPGAPDLPTGLQQLRSDGSTVIGVGATTDENTVVFRGAVTDPDPGDLVAFGVEVQPVGTAFTGIPTAVSPAVSSGTTATIAIGGLADDTEYHWRAQARDPSGTAASGWLAFGGNSDSPLPADTDFEIFIPATQLAFSSQPPASVAAGANFSVTVEAREASGIVDDAFNGDITIAIGTDPSAGAATLSGTLTRTAVNGVVTFDGLNIDITGNGYTLRVTSASVSAGTSNAFNVTASSVDPGLSTVAATPTSINTDGQTSTITVTAFDGLGNPVVGATVTLAATGTGNTLTQPSATTDANGQATGTLASTVVGDKVVTATADGVTITQTVTIPVVPGAVDPASSIANVPDGTAGATTTITVTARDANDNPLTGGGETVVVNVTGANSAVPGVTDNGNGTYTASYTPTSTGTDNVVITINGDAIGGSPFTSNVTAGGADPSQTTATVPDGTAGSPTIITVQARDANGNELATGGDNVAVTVTGANSATPAVTDNGDGTYSTQYTPTTAGDDNVAITLNGTAISGSPYTSTVSPGTGNALQIDVQPSTSAQSGVAFAQQPVVQIVDGQGNDVAQSGVSVVAAIASGGGNLGGTTNATTNASGTATFTNLSISGLVGNRTLQFSATGFVSATSNTISLTAGPVSGSNSTVAANPTSIDTDSQTSTITVTALDGAGNPIEGATVTLGATGGGNTITQPGTTNASGVTTGTISSTLVGDKTVSATINGTAVTQTAVVTVTPGAPNAGQSTASVPNGTAGTATTITVTTRDANNNALTSGGATVVVNVTGDNTVTPAVTDNGNGTYTSTYTPTNAGTDNVAITLNGTAISGSPYTSTVSPGSASGAQSAITANPTSIVANGSSSTITVQVRDTNGNDRTTGGDVVTLSTNLGSVAPSPATDNGNGTYTATLTSGTTPGTATVSGTVNGQAIGTNATVEFTVGAASPATSQITANPTSITADGVTTSTITVALRDANDNPLTAGGDNVTVATSLGSVSPTTATDNGNGTYTTTLTSATSVGTATITGTVNSSAITDNATVDFTAGTATQLVFTVQPNNVTAGQPISPAVQLTAQDAQGNTVTSFSEQVTMAIVTNPSSGTLSGTLSATPTNGVASFSNLRIDAAGDGYTIQGSSTSLTSAESNAFNVVAGTGQQLGITTQPSSSVQNGVAFSTQPVIQLQDDQGNPVSTSGVNVIAAIATGGPALGGTMNAQTDASGVATFTNLEITGATGDRTLIFSASGFTSIESGTVTVTAGPIDAGVSTVVANPTQITTDSETSTITVTARDESGNPIEGATVTLSATGTGNTITQPSATTNASGVATGTISSTDAGDKTVSADIDGTGVTQTAVVTVVAGAVSAGNSTVSANPTAFTTDESSTVTVTVLDANNNPIQGSSVTFSSTGSNNTFNPTNPTTDASGVATTTFSSTTAEGKTITATADATVITQTAAVTVNVGAVSAGNSTVSANPTTITTDAGQSSTITVTALDANSNPIQGATVTLSATGTGNTITQPASTTNASGVATGTISSTDPGDKTVSADIDGTGVTQTAVVTVNAGAAAQLSITTQPSTSAANGAAFAQQPVIQLEDSNGNPVSQSGVDVEVQINSGGGTLGGTTPVQTNASGVATFSGLSITGTVGDRDLLFFSTGLTSVTSNMISITPGTADPATSQITANPTSIQADGSSTSAITVQLRDQSSNNLTSGGDNVTLQTDAGSLSTPVTDVGDGTYTATLTSSTNVETATITGTVNSSAITDNATVNFTAGAASQLVFTVGPASTDAGVNFTPALTVTAQDGSGNTDPNFTDDVTVAIGTNPSSGVLDGTVTVAAIAGVATFSNLNIDEAGNGYTLTASSGALNTTSSAFNITAGNATVLVFTGNPGNAVAGATLTPVEVTARDSVGNTDPSFGDNVVANIGTNPGSAGLNGTTSVAAVSGVATFNTLNITVAATGYDLTASSGVLTGATSGSFDITPDVVSASVSTVTANPLTITTDSENSTLTVTVLDQFSNPIQGVLVTPSATGTGNTLSAAGNTNASGVYSGTLSSTDVGDKTVSADAGGTALNQMPVVTVNPGAASGATSQITASPTSIAADGVTTSTITVQLMDANGNNLTTGTDTVVLSTTAGTLSIVTDNNDGTYTATLTSSTTVETATVTGTVNGGNITDNATVDFT